MVMLLDPLDTLSVSEEKDEQLRPPRASNEKLATAIGVIGSGQERPGPSPVTERPPRSASQLPDQSRVHRGVLQGGSLSRRPSPGWFNTAGAIGLNLVLGLGGAASLGLRSEAQAERALSGPYEWIDYPLHAHADFLTGMAENVDEALESALGLGGQDQEASNQAVAATIGGWFDWAHKGLARLASPIFSGLGPERQEQAADAAAGGILLLSGFVLARAVPGRRGKKKSQKEESRELAEALRKAMEDPALREQFPLLEHKPVQQPGTLAMTATDLTPFQAVPYDVFFTHAYRRRYPNATYGSKRSRREYERYRQEVEGYNEMRARYMDAQDTASKARAGRAWAQYQRDLAKRQAEDRMMNPEEAWARMEREQALAKAIEEEALWVDHDLLLSGEISRPRVKEFQATGVLEPYRGISLDDIFASERGGARIDPFKETAGMQIAILDPATRKPIPHSRIKGVHYQIWKENPQLQQWSFLELDKKGYVGYIGASGKYYTRAQALRMQKKVDPSITKEPLASERVLESSELRASQERLKNRPWMKPGGKTPMSRQRGGPASHPRTKKGKGKKGTPKGKGEPKAPKVPFMEVPEADVSTSLTYGAQAVTGTKAISGLRLRANEIQKRTGDKALHDLLDTFEAPERFMRPGENLRDLVGEQWIERPMSPASFTEGYRKAMGKFGHRLDDMFARHGQRWAELPHRIARLGRRLSNSKNRALRRDLLRPAGPKTPLGQAARQWMDDLYKYAEKSGVDVAHYLAGYYPLVFNPKAVKKGMPAFRQLLREAKVPPEYMDMVINSILGNKGIIEIPRWEVRLRLSGRGGALVKYRKAKQLEIERKVFKDIPKEKLAPFLEQDVYTSLDSYMSHVLSRSEAAKRWGANEEKFTDMIGRSMEAAARAGDETALTPTMIRQLYDMKDTLERTWRNAPRSVQRALRGIAAYEVLTKLAYAGVHSTPEFMSLVKAPGAKQALVKALATLPYDFGKQAVRHFIYKGPDGHILGPSSGRFWAHQIDKARSAAATEQQSALFGGDVAGPVSQAFFNLTLQTQWLNAMNYLASNTFKDMAIGYANYMLGKKGSQVIHPLWWGGGKRGTQWRRKFEDDLRYYGVEPEALVEWVRRGREFNDPFVEAQLKTGMIRFTHDSVISPRAPAMPQQFSHPLWQPLFQLLKFPTLFGNTIAKRMSIEVWAQLNQGNKMLAGTAFVNNAASLAVGFILADMAISLTDRVKYGPHGAHPVEAEVGETKVGGRRWTWAQVERRLERMGTLGLLAERVRNWKEAARWNKDPIIAAGAGPFGGDVSALSKAMLAAAQGENPRLLARFIVESYPAANTLAREYGAPLSDAGLSKEEHVDFWEDFLVDHLGFPRKSKGSKNFGGLKGQSGFEGF